MLQSLFSGFYFLDIIVHFSSDIFVLLSRLVSYVFVDNFILLYCKCSFVCYVMLFVEWLKKFDSDEIDILWCSKCGAVEIFFCFIWFSVPFFALISTKTKNYNNFWKKGFTKLFSSSSCHTFKVIFITWKSQQYFFRFKFRNKKYNQPFIKEKFLNTFD